MRCKECDYPLWNLRSRECPECGRAFAPSDYDFVADSVRFCCASCGQSYYGTGPKGHLVPNSFVCVRCGHACRMDEMVLLPTDGVDEELTRATTHPWLERSKRGIVKGWFGTIGMALGSPSALGAALPARGGVLEAGWFAIATNLIYFLIGYAVLALPFAIMGLSMGGASFGLIVRLLGTVISIPVMLVVALVVWTAITHLVLKATGGVAGGFFRTFCCLSYGSGANVLLAIPCIGGYMFPISWIWWAIAAGLMLATAQRVSGWRAQLAVWAGPLLAWVAFGALVMLLIVPSFQRGLAAASGAGAFAGAMTVTKANGGLRAYALLHNGDEPVHALRLLESGALDLSDLYEPGELARARTETVGGVALADIAALSPAQRESTIKIAEEALPADGSHRIGDLVFVYRGIQDALGSKPDPGLWRVVWAQQAAAPNAPVVAVATGSGMLSIPTWRWKESLQEQNDLRVSLGLPAIPDPFTVGMPSAAPVPAPPK